MLNWVYRLMGVHIGRDVFIMNSTFMEHDLAHVEDGATLTGLSSFLVCCCRICFFGSRKSRRDTSISVERERERVREKEGERERERRERDERGRERARKRGRTDW